LVSLPIGGIGLNLVSTLMPVDVVGNSIFDQVQGAGIHDNSDAFTETNIAISGNDVSGGTGNGIPIQVANMRWRCQPMAT